MDWTDIKTTVPAQYADTAEAIATGISGGGIYIEDYRDLEAQVEAIAHVDLIEQDLLDKRRDQVTVHLYIAPDENFAEIAALMHSRLTAAGVPYTLETAGVRQEDWETGWKQYYNAMDSGRRLAIVPSWDCLLYTARRHSMGRKAASTMIGMEIHIVITEANVSSPNTNWQNTALSTSRVKVRKKKKRTATIISKFLFLATPCRISLKLVSFWRWP